MLRKYWLLLPLVLLAACATTTGGPTDPFLSKLIPGTLADNPTVLTGYATEQCNAGAAREYNANMVICGNPTAFVAQIPGQPFVTPAQIAQAIGAVCAVNGYTAGLPATVTVGGCTFASPTPAATPVPASKS